MKQVHTNSRLYVIADHINGMPTIVYKGYMKIYPAFFSVNDRADYYAQFNIGKKQQAEIETVLAGKAEPLDLSKIDKLSDDLKTDIACFAVEHVKNVGFDKTLRQYLLDLKNPYWAQQYLKCTNDAKMTKLAVQ